MEEAARLGHQAATLAEQTPSDRVRVKAIELYQYANTHCDIPMIANMRDHLRSLCTTQPV